MTTIDLFIIGVIGAGAVTGFMKGFIRQLASLLGLVVGLIAARTLYLALAEKLCPAITDSMTVAQIIAFVMIWIAVPLVFSIVASVLTKTVEIISLGWLNRSLGALLGALKLTLLLSLFFIVLDSVDTHGAMIGQTKKSASSLYYSVKGVSGLFIPAVKQMTQQYILNNNDTTRRTQ